MSASSSEVLDDEKNSVVDHKVPNIVQIKEEQEEPEAHAIKVEPVELWLIQDGQISVKQETNNHLGGPPYEEIFHNVPEPVRVKEEQEEPEPVQIKVEQHDLWSNQNEYRVLTKHQPEPVMVTPTKNRKRYIEHHLNKNQHLSGNQLEDKSQHQQGRDQEHSGSSRDEDVKPDRRPKDTINHRDDVDSPKLERPNSDDYQCNKCGQRFSEPNTLAAHMKAHLAEKPYSCNICGYCCRDANQLSVHVRIHTGEIPYSCELCDRSFTTQSYLARHLKSHTNEKPHSCRLCDKSFTQI